MRSSLTSRNVCRRVLVSHELFSPASALSGLSLASSPLSTRPRRALVQPSSHRTFLDFLRAKPPREVKHVGFEPGFETFLDFRANTLDKVKPPSDEQLVQAVRKFFNHKLSTKKPVNSTQALIARDVIQHLQSKKAQWREDKLSIQDLKNALQALRIPHRLGPSEDVAELATVIFNELRALQARILIKKPENEALTSKLVSPDLLCYLAALTHHGQTVQAAEIVSSYSEETKSEPELLRRLLILHLLILKGYERERDYYRLRLYAQMMCSNGFPYTSEFQGIMTTAFANMGEAGEEELREWFQKPVEASSVHAVMNKRRTDLDKIAPHKVYSNLVDFSFNVGRQPDWITAALQELCDMNPPKAFWDVIFKWAVFQGKDIDHIKTMVDVVAQINPEDESVRVDIATINGMLQAAFAMKQYFLAERINSLASQLGLRPSILTHGILLKSRIEGHDKMGAASAFEDVIHFAQARLPAINTVLNSYIRFVSHTSDSANLIGVLSRVEVKGEELEPETVADVCLKLLRDDKTLEVIDTLGLHLNQFSMSERRIIRLELVRYCLDMSISTARAWDVYSLLRQFWPESPREERTKLMQSFFSRKRPDMACRVFGHMRAHPDDSIRPDLDIYVLCLENLGAFPDSDSLAMIHNMFKMDALIQPSTRLYNAFMIAYTGCGEPRKAFEFWRQVANSKDGPTYKSLELVLRACQKLPYGYDRAKVVWDKMQSLEVDMPASVYDAFTLMVAGQGGLEKTKEMLVARAAEHSEEPSQLLLTRVFNALPDPNLQTRYKEWASLEFPEKWQKIQKLRKTKTLVATDRILIPSERITAD